MNFLFRITMRAFSRYLDVILFGRGNLLDRFRFVTQRLQFRSNTFCVGAEELRCPVFRCMYGVGRAGYVHRRILPRFWIGNQSPPTKGSTNVASLVFAGCYSDSVHHGWAPPCGFYNARPRRAPTYFSGVASTLKISCPPGASEEFFNCSALSCPAAKPPFCSTTRFREAYTTNFHAIGFSPAFIFRLKGTQSQPFAFLNCGFRNCHVSYRHRFFLEEIVGADELSTRRTGPVGKLDKIDCRYDTVPFTWSCGPLTVECEESLLPAPFDIFKRQPDGNDYWVEAAQDLETAKARARILVKHFPGQYVIVDNTTGEKVFIGTKPN